MGAVARAIETSRRRMDPSCTRPPSLDHRMIRSLLSRTLMKLSALDLNLLVAFDALANEGSVTRAAAKLHVSQPALSGALARLRHHFQDPLFVRQSGKMRPTLRAR